MYILTIVFENYKFFIVKSIINDNYIILKNENDLSKC